MNGPLLLGDKGHAKASGIQPPEDNQHALVTRFARVDGGLGRKQLSGCRPPASGGEVRGDDKVPHEDHQGKIRRQPRQGIMVPRRGVA
jgi:hypothetical protein